MKKLLAVLAILNVSVSSYGKIGEKYAKEVGTYSVIITNELPYSVIVELVPRVGIWNCSKSSFNIPSKTEKTIKIARRCCLQEVRVKRWEAGNVILVDEASFEGSCLHGSSVINIVDRYEKVRIAIRNQ